VAPLFYLDNFAIEPELFASFFFTKFLILHNTVPRLGLHECSYRSVSYSSQRLSACKVHNEREWQTEEQTDWQTTSVAIA